MDKYGWRLCSSCKRVLSTKVSVLRGESPQRGYCGYDCAVKDSPVESYDAIVGAED